MVFKIEDENKEISKNNSFKSESRAKSNFIFRAILNHYTVEKRTKSVAEIENESWLIPNLVKFNRWYCMPAALLVQFCCGSLYSWSIFNKPIDNLIYGKVTNTAPITFYFAVGFLGLASSVMGPWLERHGPKLACSLGTTLFFFGHLLTALGLYLKIIWLVFIGYGVVGGFGIGVCYISPVSALQKWFPDKRGFAAGFAVCGFGAGSIVISKIQLPLINAVGLPLTFVILGSSYFIVMIFSAMVLRTPPPNYLICPSAPATDEVEISLEDDKDQEISIDENKDVHPTLIEAITSRDFRLMMIMFSGNIVFGIVLISRLSNIITDVFSKTSDEASTIVSINGGFNLVGRLLVAIISDFIGRKNCFIVMLSCQVVILGCFSTMTNNGLYWPFLAGMWIVTACYGSGFGLIPAFLTDKFGSSNTGACHGIILIGWSINGVAGGLIFTYIFDSIIANGYSTKDPYAYNVNVCWLFGIVALGWLSLFFVEPTNKDNDFKNRLRNIFCPCCRKSKTANIN